MRGKKWKLLGVLIILFIGVVLLIKIKQQNKTSGEIISEIRPVYGRIQIFISTTGTVQPRNRLEIKPPISGRIEEIKVSEGEKVKIGQTLAWMSSTERAALLDAARAQGEESLRYWQKAYKPIPLISPIEAEVIVRAVEPGQTITSSDAVIVLSDYLIVKAQVDETDIGKVKLGQQATVSLDAYPQEEVKAIVGHIAYESKIINNVTMYEVDIVPEKVPGIFRSGMSANVNIIEQDKKNILVIPLEAVRRDREGSFVILSQSKGKKAVKRRVGLGIFDDSSVEIISGIEAKDLIMVEIQSYLPSHGKAAGSNPFLPSFRKKRH